MPLGTFVVFVYLKFEGFFAIFLFLHIVEAFLTNSKITLTIIIYFIIADGCANSADITDIC